MTREELVELAALDVLGLLDDYESALYTRSFHHAPAGVQDEILKLQADIASDRSLLGDDVPDPALRQRVLDAVAGSVEQDNSRLAPIASIGRPHVTERSARPRAGRQSVLGLLFGGSGQFWRAAAFVLSGAVIVLATFLGIAFGQVDQAMDALRFNRTDDDLRALLGPDFREYRDNPNCLERVLVPQAPSYPAAAAILYLNEKTNQGFLLTLGLPDNTAQQYVLRVEDEDGNSRVVSSFSSRGRFAGVPLDELEVAALTSASWVITDAVGAVLLRSV